MIGIIGAMLIETETICDIMTQKETQTISGTTFVVGKLWGVDTVVATCGPGKVFASIAAEVMALRFAPAYIINVGVAGTLSAQLGVGDLAIATATVQHDMDTSALGDPVGLVSKINVTYFECDPRLVEACRQAAEKIGVNHLLGVVATGDQFISNAKQKALIRERFEGIACEMEGGSIGHTCYVNGIPYLVIRAISDGADGGAPVDFFTFARESAQLTVHILENMLPSLA